MSISSTVKTTLPSGLMVIGEVNPAHKSAGIGFFVRTGARDESPPEAGVSHFLEHMMFKGTERRSALDITYALGNIGAQANAFTSEENTVFYSAVIPEYFESLQELLSDMLRPSLLQEEFDTEKKVILEEIALYQDRPNFYLYEQASREFFAGHPAGNPVLGTTESVSGITRDQMADYFDRRYTARNIALVAAGNFNWELFLQSAERLTFDWAQTEVERALPEFHPQRVSREYSRKNLNMAHLLLMGPGCRAQDRERYAMALLSVIIGDSSGSRFYWELVDKGIVEVASAESDERDECGCFTAYASMEPARLDEVSRTMQTIIADAFNFSPSDLERAKTKVVTRLALGSELPMGRLMSLGLEWNYRKKIHNVKEEISALEAVTIGDIEAAVRKYSISQLSEFRLIPG